MSTERWAIRAKGLGKAYRLYNKPGDRLRELLSFSRRTLHKEVWALRDLDLEVERGTITGLVGVNGAGKSTCLKLMAGALDASAGTVEVNGRVSSILELGTGFQPHLTGRQNAFVNALFLGLRPWEVDSKIEQVLEFSGIGDWVDQPLVTYSSGMQARLAFSVLTLIDPEILILDEALATGDAGFSEKCKNFVRRLCRSGCATIVASHDLGFIADACDRVLWIHGGQVKAMGRPADVLDKYREFLNGYNMPRVEDYPRPRNLVFKLESEAKDHPYVLRSFEWIGPRGEPMATYDITDDVWFGVCLASAAESGFVPSAARSGWGTTQDLGPRGRFRACRPALGPGGAAFIALPVPQSPHPLPAKLRFDLYLDDPPAPLVVSAFANGRFQPVKTITENARDDAPLLGDVGFAFGHEGKSAPAFDAKHILDDMTARRW